MRKFARSWFNNTLQFLDATFSRMAIFSSIVAFAGFQLADFPYSRWVIVFLLIYIIFGIVVSKPKYIAPPNPTSRIPIELVNEQLAHTVGVGLVGLASSGKTTFLDSTVSRPYDGKETARPYGQFVRIPDTEPPKQILLIDSVGAKNHVQFTIQALSSRLIFFLDHNEAGNAEAMDGDRIADHEELAQQVSHAAIDQNLIIDLIIVVANKSDQWQGSPATVQRMKEAADIVRQIFINSSPYRDVEVIYQYSNQSAHDVSSLLALVSK